MEEEGDYPSRISSDFTSTSSSSSQAHQHRRENEEDDRRQDDRRLASVSYRVNISLSNVTSVANMMDDVWPFLIVLVMFWFFASLTLILGFYGSVNVPLGPYCSRLVQANSLFVQSIKAQELDELLHGPMLYGFHRTPPLDVEITWSESYDVVVESSYHKEWRYFLNEGSKLDISYSVKSPSSVPLSLVIARGKESLAEWIEDPSYPNTTLSWNIIHGSGKIQQNILTSETYYIALGNLNSEAVEVQVNFTFKAFVYNTSQAYYKCSLSNGECNLKIFLMRAESAILTSPGPEQGGNYEWDVKLSYGPRWITYLVGSGVMTILVILSFRICSMFKITREDGARHQTQETGSERTPLLPPKDDDQSSWGSSYDSNSQDDEELDKWLAVEGNQLKEGESIKGPQRLCVICFDAPRDCFFLPCGHCAVCFTCGTRVLEEGGSCPVCRRTMKKVRKIFTV
ncbi:hypothetical protein LguiA_011974 [Lonicera macranthoides]